MELTKLSDRIFYLPHEEARDRPVLGYLHGACKSIAVDAGASAQHVEEFYEAIEAEGLPLPDFTLITHWHADHTFGIHACKGTVFAHANTKSHLERMLDWSWTDEAIAKRIASGEDISFGEEAMRAEYGDLGGIVVTLPDAFFSERLEFKLGGLCCQAIKVPSPHSDDAVAVLVPKEKVLFLGDATSPDFYREGQYDLTELDGLIAWLGACDFDTCLLSHWQPLGKKELLAYLQSERERIG